MTFEEYKEIAKIYEKLMRNNFDDEEMQKIKNILVFDRFYRTLLQKTIDLKKDLTDNAEVICNPIREPKIEEYEEFLKHLDLSEYSAKLNKNTFEWYDFLEKTND